MVIDKTYRIKTVLLSLIKIHLHKGSEMSFIRNYAETQGGAISVRAPTIGLDTDIIRLFNTRCFIQYEFGNVPASLDPAQWNVRLHHVYV